MHDDNGRGWALSIAIVALPSYATRPPVLAANARAMIGELPAA